MEKGESSSFSDVLRYVCKLYDIKDAKKEEEKQDPYKEFGDFVQIFKHNDQANLHLTEEVETCGSSPYFESRNFDSETLAHFSVEDCVSAHPIVKDRSIIPVFYQQLKVGYIARATKPWQSPKYLFSDKFKKANFLYNYDNSLEKCTQTSTLFLVEGQGDVWRMYESGVENCVGLFGKDVSVKQKDLLLKSGATRLVVLTDNDQAGRESKIKIQRELFRLFNLTFPKIKAKDIGEMSPQKIKDSILTNLEGMY